MVKMSSWLAVVARVTSAGLGQRYRFLGAQSHLPRVRVGGTLGRDVEILFLPPYLSRCCRKQRAAAKAGGNGEVWGRAVSLPCPGGRWPVPAVTMPPSSERLHEAPALHVLRGRGSGRGEKMADEGRNAEFLHDCCCRAGSCRGSLPWRRSCWGSAGARGR